jgi:hypothetical protein
VIALIGDSYRLKTHDLGLMPTTFEGQGNGHRATLAPEISRAGGSLSVTLQDVSQASGGPYDEQTHGRPVVRFRPR